MCAEQIQKVVDVVRDDPENSTGLVVTALDVSGEERTALCVMQRSTSAHRHHDHHHQVHYVNWQRARHSSTTSNDDRRAPTALPSPQQASASDASVAVPKAI